MNMDYVRLGRTGLQASVLGLGCGGHSRLGQRTGATKAHSVAIVRRALELGVNFFDTAEVYGTEALVGEALRGALRQDVVISTRTHVADHARLITASELTSAIEASLTRLEMDYVDVYHLHAVQVDQYDYAVAELVPTMFKLRDQGKIRFLGITESFSTDTGHVMMARAVRDPYWDVVMIGFNVLNQSARDRVLAGTRQRDIGVLCMHAVRDALSRPEKLRQTVTELVQKGLVDPEGVDLQQPLGFLSQVADSVPEAAYRFCRAEPGIHVVLSGTGNPQHLEQNVISILRPPLPDGIHQRLADMFALVDTVSGQ
jgi:aryl-alcohol dehydrogenase-like predicted oxidoreductase